MTTFICFALDEINTDEHWITQSSYDDVQQAH